jgi:chromosome segregation ATPase
LEYLDLEDQCEEEFQRLYEKFGDGLDSLTLPAQIVRRLLKENVLEGESSLDLSQSKEDNSKKEEITLNVTENLKQTKLLQETKTKCIDLGFENDRLQNLVRKLTYDLDHISSEKKEKELFILDLQSKVRDLVAKNGKLSSKNFHLQNEKEDLEWKFYSEKASSLISENKLKIAQLEKEKEEMGNCMKEFESKFSKLTEDLVESNFVTNALQQQVSNQSSQIVELSFKLSLAESEKEALKAEVRDQVRSNNMILESEKETLKELLDNERAGMDKLIQDASKTSEQLKFNNNLLAMKLDDVQRSKENLVIRTKLEAEDYRYENQLLRDEISSLLTEAHDLQNTVIDMKKMYDVSENQLNDLQCLLHNMKLEKEDIYGKLNTFVESKELDHSVSALFSSIVCLVTTELLTADGLNKSLADYYVETLLGKEYEYNRMTETIQEQNSKLATLESEKLEVIERLSAESKGIRDESEKVILALTEQLEQFALDKSEKEKENDGLMAALSAAKTENVKASHEFSSKISTILENVRVLKEEKRDVENKLIESKTEYDMALKDRNDSAAAQISSLTSRIDMLENEKRALCSELDGSKAEKTKLALELSAKIEGIDQKLREVENERSILQSKLDETKNASAVAYQALSETKSKISNLTSIISSLEAEKEGLTAEIQQLKAKSAQADHEVSVEMDNLLHKLLKLEEEKSQLSNQLKSSKTETLKLEEEKSQLSNQLKSSKTETLKLEEEKSQLSNQLKSSKTGVLRLEEEKSQLSNQLKSSKTETLKLEEDKSKLSNQLNSSKTEVLRLEEEKSQLSNKLKSSKTEILRLEEEKSQLSNQLKSFKIEAAEAMKKATEVELAKENKLVELSSRIDHLVSEKCDLQKSINELNLAAKKAQIEGLLMGSQALEEIKCTLDKSKNVAYYNSEVQITDLMSKISWLESEKILSSKAATEAYEQIETLSAQLTALETERNDQKVKLKNLEESKIVGLNNSEVQITDLMSKISWLESEKILSSKAATEAYEQIETLSAQLTELETERNALKIELNMADSRLNSAINEVNYIAEAKLAQLTSKIEIFEHEKRGLENELVELKVESGNAAGVLLAQVEQLVALLQDAETQNAKLELSLKEFGTQHEIEIREKTDLASSQIADLTTKIAEIRQEKMDLDQELVDAKIENVKVIGELSAQLEELSLRAGKLEEEKVTLQERLKAAEHEIQQAVMKGQASSEITGEELCAEIRHLSEMLRERDLEMQELEKKLSECNKNSEKMIELQSDFDKLSNRLKEVENENQDLLKQIADLKEQILEQESAKKAGVLLELPQLTVAFGTHPLIPSPDSASKLQRIIVVNGSPILKHATLPWYLTYLLEIQSSDSLLIYSFLLHHQLFTDSKTLLGMLLNKWVDTIKDQDPEKSIYMIR